MTTSAEAIRERDADLADRLELLASKHPANDWYVSLLTDAAKALRENIEASQQARETVASDSFAEQCADEFVERYPLLHGARTTLEVFLCEKFREIKA